MLARTLLCVSVLRKRRKNPFVDYGIFSLRTDSSGFKYNIQRYKIFNTVSLIPLIDARVIFN